ncbi:MAG: D-alanyl-D-alanine carboxypeptidase/D-alanyl-D-alanine-endopeptidase [Breznakibacter sp.]
MQKNLRAKLGVSLVSLFYCSCLTAQMASNTCKSFLHSVGIESSVSAVIVNIDKNDTLLSLNPHTRLVPASTLKLLTTATAIELLGSDFKYSTKVFALGDLKNSVFYGDIWVIGGGDPSFCSSYYEGNRTENVFAVVLNALKSKGIRSIAGGICVDDGYFPAINYPSTRLWEDMGNYYGAVPSSLNYLDNSLSIYLGSPKLPDQPCAIVRTEPLLPHLELDCKVRSSLSNRDSVYVFGVVGMSNWLVEGKMPAGQSSFLVKAALPVPPLCFANDIAAYLRTNTISLREESRLGSCPFGRSGHVELAVFHSASLPWMIKTVNTFSNNLWADNLFLTVGKRQTNKGSWNEARDEVKQYWSAHLKSVNDIYVADGSGLSPKNLVSSAAMVELLAYMRHSANFNHYLQSLAVGGETGTLKGMWTGREVKGRVFAKSGTISGVVAYAGYFRNRSGQWCAFSVIVNNSLKSTSQLRYAIDTLVANYVLSE